jgi:hypothetical protein
LSHPFSKEDAVAALKQGNGGAGSFCFRDGSAGKVLCVQLTNAKDIGHFRIRQGPDGKIELLDLEAVAGMTFGGLHEALQHLSENPVNCNDKLAVYLTDCLPVPAAAAAVSRPAEPVSIRTPSPQPPPPLLDVTSAAVPTAAADPGKNTWFDDSESDESDPGGFFGISI